MNDLFCGDKEKRWAGEQESKRKQFLQKMYKEMLAFGKEDMKGVRPNVYYYDTLLDDAKSFNKFMAYINGEIQWEKGDYVKCD